MPTSCAEGVNKLASFPSPATPRPEDPSPLPDLPPSDLNHPIRTLVCSHCGHPLRVQLSCGDRTCPVCRKKWFGYHYGALKKYVAKWDRVYFLTLTLKNIPDGNLYRADVERLRILFTALRKKLKGAIDAGWYVIQMTNDGNGWHLHLHAIYRGSFVPSQKLSRLWLEITKDSYIVDIRTADRWQAALRYVLSDFLQSPRIRDCDREEYNSIFKGSRLVQGFGEYSKTKLRVPFPCPCCGRSEWTDLDLLLEGKRRFHAEFTDGSPP